VKVVIEQHVGEDAPTASDRDPMEKPPPCSAIPVILHDRTPLQPAVGDVVNPITNLNAQRSSHEAHFGVRCFKLQSSPDRDRMIRPIKRGAATGLATKGDGED